MLTKKQDLVLDLLYKSDKPLSAYKILENLKYEGFKVPIEVYRVLQKLLEYGLIHRIESLNAFMACQQKQSCNKNNSIILFTICKICGIAKEIINNSIENSVRSLTNDVNFITKDTVIELKGICSKCKD